MHDRAEGQGFADAQELNNFAWKIIGRTPTGLSSGNWLPEIWRGQLAVRLGYRPRRIGILAELALYGALDCLEKADEKELPKDVMLRICSLRGPVSAISHVIEQMSADLPMPFSFLQSQTSQILPALAGALNWQGDASVVMAHNPMNLAMLACQQAGRRGMLLGWVEEENPHQNFWIRLVPSKNPTASFIAASNFEEMISPSTHYWRVGRAGIEIASISTTSDLGKVQ